MKNTCDIGVVIPTHNRSFELKRAIDSVLNQTYTPCEIWIVDDASSENISDVVRDFNCDKLHYFRLPEKGNANIARNKGAELCSSHYIAFLDSDDEWLNHHLENFILNKDKLHDGYFSNVNILRDLKAGPIKHSSQPLLDFSSPMNFLLGGGIASTSTYIISKSAFDQLKFDPYLKRHQDFDFFVRFYLNFKWKQLNDHTIIIHWERNRKVSRYAEDEMIFIRKYKDLLDPYLFKRYLRIQYDYFFENGTKDDYQLHQQELIHIVHILKLSEYLSFHKEKSKLLQRILLSIQFFFFKVIRFKSKLLPNKK
jgi:glycosyltransferase involved in cell wall biosynthesis